MVGAATPAPVSRWTVIGSGTGRSLLCRCQCGTEKLVNRSNLVSGKTKSCGCLRRELSAINNTTHGERRGRNTSVEYRTWLHMIDRCDNPNDKSYHDYGARGITVCERWRRSFADFLADLGRRPSAEHTIERKDNDGPYSPNNARWATRLEQNRNKRNNRRVKIGKKTLCVSEWLSLIDLSGGAYWGRVNRGWTIERALTTPALTSWRRGRK